MNSLITDVWRNILKLMDDGDYLVLFFVNLRLRSIVFPEFAQFSGNLCKAAMRIYINSNRFNLALFVINDVNFHDNHMLYSRPIADINIGGRIRKVVQIFWHEDRGGPIVLKTHILHKGLTDEED